MVELARKARLGRLSRHAVERGEQRESSELASFLYLYNSVASLDRNLVFNLYYDFTVTLLVIVLLSLRHLTQFISVYETSL